MLGATNYKLKTKRRLGLLTQFPHPTEKVQGGSGEDHVPLRTRAGHSGDAESP